MLQTRPDTYKSTKRRQKRNLDEVHADVAYNSISFLRFADNMRCMHGPFLRRLDRNTVGTMSNETRPSSSFHRLEILDNWWILRIAYLNSRQHGERSAYQSWNKGLRYQEFKLNRPRKVRGENRVSRGNLKYIELSQGWVTHKYNSNWAHFADLNY